MIPTLCILVIISISNVDITLVRHICVVSTPKDLSKTNPGKRTPDKRPKLIIVYYAKWHHKYIHGKIRKERSSTKLHH